MRYRLSVRGSGSCVIQRKEWWWFSWESLTVQNPRWDPIRTITRSQRIGTYHQPIRVNEINIAYFRWGTDNPEVHFLTEEDAKTSLQQMLSREREEKDEINKIKNFRNRSYHQVRSIDLHI